LNNEITHQNGECIIYNKRERKWQRDSINFFATVTLSKGKPTNRVTRQDSMRDLWCATLITTTVTTTTKSFPKERRFLLALRWELNTEMQIIYIKLYVP
jgi:hypothetical protein